MNLSSVELAPGTMITPSGAAGSADVVAVNANDEIVVAGRVAPSIDFGGGTLTAADADDMFLVKLSP